MAESMPPPRLGFAIASLVLGILSLPTFGLLVVGAMLTIVLGVVAVVKASREPERFGGRRMAIAGIVLGAASLVLIPFLGIGAAIALPSVVRVRRARANEKAAIADVRQLMAAEARYRHANSGRYNVVECLTATQTCIPGRTSAALIDSRLASR